MLQHHYAVGGGQRQRAAGPALADDDGDQRHREIEAGFDAAGDRLGLAARLGVDPGIGARRIDKGDDRQAKAIGRRISRCALR